ncbi:hypothetical protein FGG08_007433 [Glutinoglossum americanum]|uniref:Ankyrin n=1 Tax=Glutinoglossum americanum TaxID=1670608 RepID=A0A9P8KWF0_9PEZI|nr:hypothetical protein FGG08_007433 [Glutinoglossum americanum]
MPPHTPLGIRSANARIQKKSKTSRTELSPHKCSVIEGLRKAGCSIKDISEIENTPCSTTMRFEEGAVHHVRQLKEKKDAGPDVSGHLLRIAAAYGSSLALKILADKCAANVNDVNDIQETPLLFAARSGYLDALLTLHLNADLTAISETEDIPPHWLCSFDENDAQEAAAALVRAGADVKAQAGGYPDDGNLEYARTDYIAGTPPHRAIARNGPSAVEALLDLGADPDSPAGDDTGLTPFALAVLLHCPEIVTLFLSHMGHDPSRMLLPPSGKSILTCAMPGSTLYGATMGRLIRHGLHLVSRAEETVAILLKAGAASHLRDLPGIKGVMEGLTEKFTLNDNDDDGVDDWTLLDGERSSMPWSELYAGSSHSVSKKS